jgi:hypothetical protein
MAPARSRPDRRVEDAVIGVAGGTPATLHGLLWPCRFPRAIAPGAMPRGNGLQLTQVNARCGKLPHYRPPDRQVLRMGRRAASRHAHSRHALRRKPPRCPARPSKAEELVTEQPRLAELEHHGHARADRRLTQHGSADIRDEFSRSRISTSVSSGINMKYIIIGK